MHYTITAINGCRSYPEDYTCITLCPTCHKHFIIDSVFDSRYADTDVSYMHRHQCTICNMRYTPLYNYCDDTHFFFDGYLDNMTNEYIPLCDFDKHNPKVFPDYAIITKHTALMNEAASRVPAGYIDLLESDEELPF